MFEPYYLSDTQVQEVCALSITELSEISERLGVPMVTCTELLTGKRKVSKNNVHVIREAKRIINESRY